MTRVLSMAVILLMAAPSALLAQGRPDPVKLMAAQKEAMTKLAAMDGQWRGSAWTLLPSGEKHTITQTERVGPLLDGTVKVIEGRGYDAEGKTTFNAFATLSFNPASGAYTLHSHAMGSVGDFALTPTAEGFQWEIPAGPMVIRYTATLRGGIWKEVGDRILPGKEPIRFFEMTLQRLGDSPWPAAGAVPAK